MEYTKISGYISFIIAAQLCVKFSSIYNGANYILNVFVQKLLVSTWYIW